MGKKKQKIWRQSYDMITAMKIAQKAKDVTLNLCLLTDAHTLLRQALTLLRQDRQEQPNSNCVATFWLVYLMATRLVHQERHRTSQLNWTIAHRWVRSGGNLSVQHLKLRCGLQASLVLDVKLEMKSPNSVFFL